MHLVVTDRHLILGEVHFHTEDMLELSRAWFVNSFAQPEHYAILTDSPPDKKWLIPMPARVGIPANRVQLKIECRWNSSDLAD
jgi:hypothetical protein